MSRRALLLSLLLSGTLAAAPPDGTYKNSQCIACHGPQSPAVHSYTTSKHGVLVEISLPGRAPDCVGCHTAQAHTPVATEGIRQICNQCHSPRYVQTLNSNGARMIEIGHMKLREAESLLTRAKGEFPDESLHEMERHYARMQQHLTNLRLGVAHQSPDYQWWHGHPALDGDLLRLKGAYDQLVRKRTLQQQR